MSSFNENNLEAVCKIIAELLQKIIFCLKPIIKPALNCIVTTSSFGKSRIIALVKNGF